MSLTKTVALMVNFERFGGRDEWVCFDLGHIITTAMSLGIKTHKK